MWCQAVQCDNFKHLPVHVCASCIHTISIIVSHTISAVGSVPGPFDCYLANRGLKTLHVRMRQHEQNAFAVARFLLSSPHVEETIFPGEPLRRVELHSCHVCRDKMETMVWIVLFEVRYTNGASIWSQMATTYENSQCNAATRGHLTLQVRQDRQLEGASHYTLALCYGLVSLYTK